MRHTAWWKQRILSFIFDNNASSSLLGTCCQANVGFVHFHLACLTRQIHINVGVARFLKDDNLRSRAVESACRGAGKKWNDNRKMRVEAGMEPTLQTKLRECRLDTRLQPAANSRRALWSCNSRDPRRLAAQVNSTILQQSKRNSSQQLQPFLKATFTTSKKYHKTKKQTLNHEQKTSVAAAQLRWQTHHSRKSSCSLH